MKQLNLCRSWLLCGSLRILGPFILGVFLLGGTGRSQDLPQPGKLYVVDTGGEFFENSRVLLLDASTGAVLKTFPAGEDPDIALSPDGSRLYVTSILREGTSAKPWLSIYETDSGRLLTRVGNEEAVQHTMPVYASTLAMSPSGRWLYMVKFHGLASGGYYFYLAAFDTVNKQFLSEKVELPSGASVMLPAEKDLDVTFAYMSNSAIYDVTLGGTAGRAKRISVSSNNNGPIATSDSAAAFIANIAPKGSLSAAFLSPLDGKVIVVESSDGSVFSVDKASESSAKVSRISQLGKNGMNAATISQSGASVYFQNDADINAAGRGHAFSQSNQILSVDPKTYAVKGLLKTKDPFSTMALSKDDKILYTVDPDSASITVIDAATLTEIKKLPGVGKRPIFAVTAP